MLEENKSVLVTWYVEGFAVPISTQLFRLIQLPSYSGIQGLLMSSTILEADSLK